MSDSSISEEQLRDALYEEFRLRFAEKEEIINNIELIDNRLVELGVSDKLLNNAKLIYFSKIKEFRDNINDQDQLNIYIQNILKAKNRTKEEKPTEE